MGECLFNIIHRTDTALCLQDIQISGEAESSRQPQSNAYPDVSSSDSFFFLGAARRL